MDPQQLRTLETLCSQFYSSYPEEQRLAHQTLFPLVGNIQNVPQFQAVLAQSKDPQALLFAANALLKLFTSEWNMCEESQKESTRSFLLNYLYQHGKELLRPAPVTLNALIRLLVRIVRLQWLEKAAYQNICEQLKPFFAATTADWVVGISIYCELTADMAPKTGGGLARARRTAFAFRDSALPIIFTAAIDTLKQFSSGAIKTSNPEEETQLLRTVLQLALSSLSFDFMGTLPDETNDERSDPVMIPTSWTIIKESNLPRLFFDIYADCCKAPVNAAKAECARLCLQCLVQVASLRRSYFTKDDERAAHLTELISVTSAIFDSGMGVSQDSGCYHQFCRLLGKINASVPILDLKACLQQESSPNHLDDPPPARNTTSTRSERSSLASTSPSLMSGDAREWGPRDSFLFSWLGKVCDFTLNGLRQWTYQANSKHYLLGFWSSLVNPLLSRSAKLPPEIGNYVHVIFTEFIKACLKIGEACALLDAAFNSDAINAMAPYLLFDVNEVQNAVDLEDPLEHEVFRAEQLDVIQSLGRVNYVNCVRCVTDHWDSVLQLVESASLPQLLIEKRFTWLVYIIGALIAGQNSTRNIFNLRLPCFTTHNLLSRHNDSSMSTEDSDPTADGLTSDSATLNLSARVFRLIMTTGMATNDNWNESSIEPRELAFLFFLDSFRKAEMSDITELQSGSREAKLKEAIGADEDISSLILRKTLSNLQTRGKYEPVIRKSLRLFRDMSGSVLMIGSASHPSHILSGKLLLKSPVVKSLLTAEGSRAIADCFDGVMQGKHRTAFYNTLTQLFFLSLIDLSQSPDSGNGVEEESIGIHFGPEQLTFHAYMQPLADVMTAVWPIAGPDGPSSGQLPNMLAQDVRNPDQRRMIAGLFRDLRGICQTASETYIHFFNWLVNRPKRPEMCRLHLISVVLQHMWNDPPVAIAALRLAAEITTNRGQRIAFDPSSPNGIILFKEVSSILSAYGPNILAQPADSFKNLYREKYKGLAISLQLFSNALASNFANFGAFEAYSDQTLPNAIKLGLEMCHAIPEEDLQSFSKSLKPYYTFIEIVCHHHVSHIFALSPPAFARILRTLEDGICAYNTTISLQACSTLCHLTKHVLARLQFDDPMKRPTVVDMPQSEEEMETWKVEANCIRQLVAAQPSCFKRVLQLCFQLIMTGESSSTWSMASAVLGLILLDPEEYRDIQTQLVTQQTSNEKKERLKEYFEHLMDGVEGVMSQGAKEQFMRNLYTFTQNVRNQLNNA